MMVSVSEESLAKEWNRMCPCVHIKDSSFWGMSKRTLRVGVEKSQIEKRENKFTETRLISEMKFCFASKRLAQIPFQNVGQRSPSLDRIALLHSFAIMSLATERLCF